MPDVNQLQADYQEALDNIADTVLHTGEVPDGLSQTVIADLRKYLSRRGMRLYPQTRVTQWQVVRVTHEPVHQPMVPKRAR